MNTLKNKILMICEVCSRVMLANRADYEKKGILAKAIFVKNTCDRCQEPGNFYEDEDYYNEDGLISWKELWQEEDQTISIAK